MSLSGKITRFNMHQLPAYDRLQYMRSRRQESAALVENSMTLAYSFSSIQSNNVTAQGNLYSRIAMQRISKKA